MVTARIIHFNIITRIRRDPAFAKALRNYAATLFRSGEIEDARSILRFLTKALRHQTTRGLFTYRP